MSKAPVVLMTFGGRRDRMAILRRYAEEAMRRGIIDEWHVWNFARTQQDDAWLQSSFPSIRRTADDRLYRHVPAARIEIADRHVLGFQVRAGHNAHIALIADGYAPSYELVLGGWGNSAVALRIVPAGTDPDHTQSKSPPGLIVATPALLSRRAWRSVELEISRAPGQLCLALRVDGREVLRTDMNEPVATAFAVAVMSGYGAEAEWRFNGARADGLDTGLFYAARQPVGHQWNPIYQHYVDRADDYVDTVFLKCDDDIVYFDLDRLAEFIRFRCDNPNYFLVSANVINNGICAQVQQSLGMLPQALKLEIPPGGFGGSLWESGSTAEAVHRHFLAAPAAFKRSAPATFIPRQRFSINFVAWLGADLPCFDTRFADDEQDLTVTLPRYHGRRNAIYLPFLAAHLSFRPQDAAINLPALLGAYRDLADDELNHRREVPVANRTTRSQRQRYGSPRVGPTDISVPSRSNCRGLSGGD
jgi:hypothetical protein